MIPHLWLWKGKARSQLQCLSGLAVVYPGKWLKRGIRELLVEMFFILIVAALIVTIHILVTYQAVCLKQYIVYVWIIAINLTFKKLTEL